MKKRALALVVFGTATLLVSGTANAGMIDATIFFSREYQQISPVTVIPFNGGTNNFFSSIAIVNNFNDFDANGITVQVPTSPPTSDILATPFITGLEGGGTSPAYRFDTNYFTPAQFAAQFPTGMYVVTAKNTSTAAQLAVSLNYTGNHFANVPTLSAGTYSSLNGLDPNQPFTFNWAQLTPDISINKLVEFFTITDSATQSVVFSQTFFSNITSITVPAGTLLPDTAYIEELNFSPRINETNPAMIPCIATGTTCPGRTEVGFDTRTITDFTTGIAAAVPEPSSFSLLLTTGILTGLSLICRQLRGR